MEHVNKDVQESDQVEQQAEQMSAVRGASGTDHVWGRGPRVLSTTLGVALVANLLLAPGLMSHSVAHAAETAQPQLTEWSSEDVKSYFDPSLDWSLPALPDEDLGGVVPPAAGTGTGTTGTTGTSASGNNGGTNTVIVHQGSSFGWDDMLLYHMLFNSGGAYSSGRWHQDRPVYDARTNQPYQPKTYSQGSFENKQVPGTNVKPKTSVSSGTFSTKAGKSSSSSKTGTASGSNSSSTSKSSGTTAGSTKTDTKAPAANNSGTTGSSTGSSSSSKSSDTTGSSTGSSSTKSSGTTGSTGSTSSGSSSSGSSSSKSSSGSGSSSSKSSSSSSSSKSSSSGSVGGKSSGFSSSSGS